MSRNRWSNGPGQRHHHGSVGASSLVTSVKVERGKHRTFDVWLSGELKKLETRWASFIVESDSRKTGLPVSARH